MNGPTLMKLVLAGLFSLGLIGVGHVLSKPYHETRMLFRTHKPPRRDQVEAIFSLHHTFPCVSSSSSPAPSSSLLLLLLLLLLRRRLLLPLLLLLLHLLLLLLLLISPFL